jgi:hypothetical protein
MRLHSTLLVSLFLAVAPGTAMAQSTGQGTPAAPATAPDTSQAGAVRVFLDCQSSRCDYDFSATRCGG